jgi:hypothetical protein
MNINILTALVVGTLGTAAGLSSPVARADDQFFSLSAQSNYSSNQYATGPWLFKLTVPSTMSSSPINIHEIGNNRTTTGAPNGTNFGLTDTEAAASYNVYAGSASSPGIDLTGKVRVNTANISKLADLTQNDYAAQMDVYQSVDKFTAKGSLGSMVLGSPTGIILSPVLYGSFGGIYQFSEQTSTGVDMSLSQDSVSPGIMQHELSAYVNYKLDKKFKARGYVLRGYSNGNRNSIVGGQVYYGF